MGVGILVSATVNECLMQERYVDTRAHRCGAQEVHIHRVQMCVCRQLYVNVNV